MNTRIQENTITNRYSRTLWRKVNSCTHNILVVGLGGIGSYLSFLLSRNLYDMNIPITLMDDDIVSDHNIGTQLFKHSNVDMKKTNAIYDLIGEMSDKENITIIDSKFRKNSVLKHNVIFSCVDNLETRKLLFDRWLNLKDREIFIDGRLSAKHLQIYTIKSNDNNAIEMYKSLSFDDEVHKEAVCTLRQTVHAAMTIASLMCGIYMNHLSNIAANDTVVSVPSFVEFNYDMFLFNVNR